MKASISNIGGLVVALFVMTACGGGGDGDDGPDPEIPVTTATYEVDFSADQLIGRAAAPATVTATAALSTARGDGTTASGSVTVSGTAATSVSIHVGYAGENGPVAVALTDGGGGTWNVPPGTEIDDEEFFRLEAAGYYVSIETPEGTLRGQILPQNWVAAIVELDADSVVPVSTSSGTAKAGLTLDAVTGRYRIRMTVSGVSDATGAAVRNAIAGARGDVVISLEQSVTNPNVWGSGDINNINIDNRLTLSGLDLLATGALYLSLESATNMQGDLRGQIIDGTIDIFDIVLTTSEVITSGPPVASDAQGVATVTWNESLSRFGLSVNTDITNAIGVFINQGAAGENGTLLFSLIPDVTVPGNWVLSPAELSADQVAAFLADEFYVTVVTGTYPEGELRGQLDSDASDTT